MAVGPEGIGIGPRVNYHMRVKTRGLGRVSIGCACIVTLSSCAFPFTGDRLIRVSGQIETTEQDCRIRVFRTGGHLVHELRVDAKFHTGFAGPMGHPSFVAEIWCAAGQLKSRQYEFRPPDSKTVDLGVIQLQSIQAKKP